MDHKELQKALGIKDRLNAVSPSFCTVKWKHASLNLQAGTVKSCCHLQYRPVELGPSGSQLHDTTEDRRERAMMLKGEKPSNCSVCWWVESQGQLSDRITWSSKSWAEPFLQEVVAHSSPEAQKPSWVELNFSNVCNLKCSYCSPIFSSKWMSEIQQYGAYPTEPRHNDPAYLPVNPSFDNKELMQHFWPWFTANYNSLRLLKMTGGEPLLNANAFGVLERVKNQSHPELSLSLNSSLMIPAGHWERFIELISSIHQHNSVKRFYLHPSIDSFGARAEYIRHGLQFELFCQRVEDYLERTRGHLVFICTLNNLSLGGLTDLWRYLLTLKKRFGPRGQWVSISTEPLISPVWQRVSVLPAEHQSWLQETIAFVRSHQGADLQSFSESEIQGLERGLAMMKDRQSLPDSAQAERNFYRFFAEHDRRRKTDFNKVFPELQSFWQQCRNQVELSENKVSLSLELEGESQPLDLSFTVFNTPTAQRWLKLLQTDLQKKLWFDGIFYGSLFQQNDRAQLNEQINELLRQLEAPGGRLFTRYYRDNHDQQSLDEIHHLRVELAKLSHLPGCTLPLEFHRKLDWLNFLIHRFEFSVDKVANGGSIVAVPLPPSKIPLSDEDYKEFTLDKQFATVYLDYGTEGAPILDCFLQDLKQKPTPQREMSSGFNICLWPDDPFTQQQALRQWMQTHSPDWVDNPQSALGQIPLGRLVLDNINKDDLLNSLRRAKTIRQIRLHGPSSAPARPQTASLAVDGDAFSDGQIGSKLWLCEVLESLANQLPPKPTLWIYGGWYGMLAFLLFSRNRMPIQNIRSFDLDPQVEVTADRLNNHWEFQQWKFKAHTLDVNDLDITDRRFGPSPQIIVNTSTEHFANLTWWQKIPRGTFVALQATDMEIADHVARVESLEDMKARFEDTSELLYSGEKAFHYPNFSFRRFMLIGRK